MDVETGETTEVVPLPMAMEMATTSRRVTAVGTAVMTMPAMTEPMTVRTRPLLTLPIGPTIDLHRMPTTPATTIHVPRPAAAA
jgi:hypothetical protein